MIALIINEVDNAMSITYHSGGDARTLGVSIDDYNQINLADLITMFKEHSEMDAE